MTGEIRINDFGNVRYELEEALEDMPSDARISYIEIGSTDGHEGFIREIVIHWSTEI